VTITHAVLALDVGGLERIVIAMAAEQIRRGDAASIVCIDRPGELAAEAEAAGISVQSLDRATTSSRLAPLSNPPVDILHTHQIGAAVALRRHLKNQPRRWIHTEHGNAIARAVRWLDRVKLRVRFRQVASRIDRFACVSEEIYTTLSRFATVPKSKLTVIANGIAAPPPGIVSTRAALGIAESAFVIGTVGRLHEVKRQDLLLHAAAKLDSVIVLIVGDGPERAALVQLATTLGIADRVIFAGYQAEPWPYLAAMNVFALTSRSEGFPVSLLEAWAMQRPVVCTAVGGLPQIIDHDRDGLLVPPGDTVSLAAALRRLMSDSPFANSIAAAGLEKYRSKYTLECVIRQYDGLYQSP
jgi:glycosyltransferase involved in cell wall biosynthesis